MEKRYNIWSFYLIIASAAFALYTLYATFSNVWFVSPPNYILLLMSLTAFTLGVKGLKDKRNWRVRIRSWVTLLLSAVLSILLVLVLLLSLFASLLGATTHLKTVKSPDNHYTIDFYKWDEGAAGTLGIRGELNGPLWFKKRIYNEKRVEELEVEWINNHEVIINKHRLKLNEGETFGY